jgi:hypothetical protein
MESEHVRSWRSEDVSQTRQRAYRQLLENGLVAVRNCAHAGRLALCEIEADHIHNLPSLLDEPNETRHVYYIVGERRLYLDRLKTLGADEYLEEMMNFYGGPWKGTRFHRSR